jgi:hypothetical protein
MGRRDEDSPDVLNIYLIIDTVSDQFVTSTRLGVLGSVTDAAIFRSMASAEQGVKKMERHIASYALHPLNGAKLQLEVVKLPVVY